jgi:hypothetical protein
MDEREEEEAVVMDSSVGGAPSTSTPAPSPLLLAMDGRNDEKSNTLTGLLLMPVERWRMVWLAIIMVDYDRLIDTVKEGMKDQGFLWEEDRRLSQRL